MPQEKNAGGKIEKAWLDGKPFRINECPPVKSGDKISVHFNEQDGTAKVSVQSTNPSQEPERCGECGKEICVQTDRLHGLGCKVGVCHGHAPSPTSGEGWNPTKEAQAIIADFNVLTAGEGEYADDGIYANRFQGDVRRSDVNAWLIERIAGLLSRRDEEWRARLEGLEGCAGGDCHCTKVAQYCMDQVKSEWRARAREVVDGVVKSVENIYEAHITIIKPHQVPADDLLFAARSAADKIKESLASKRE